MIWQFEEVGEPGRFPMITVGFRSYRPAEADPLLRRAASLAARHGLPAIAAQAASGLGR
jgi:hypothetical protein